LIRENTAGASAKPAFLIVYGPSVIGSRNKRDYSGHNLQALAKNQAWFRNDVLSVTGRDGSPLASIALSEVEEATAAPRQSARGRSGSIVARHTGSTGRRRERKRLLLCWNGHMLSA
jgi:hypothetical protein